MSGIEPLLLGLEGESLGEIVWKKTMYVMERKLDGVAE